MYEWIYSYRQMGLFVSKILFLVLGIIVSCPVLLGLIWI